MIGWVSWFLQRPRNNICGSSGAPEPIQTRTVWLYFKQSRGIHGSSSAPETITHTITALCAHWSRGIHGSSSTLEMIQTQSDLYKCDGLEAFMTPPVLQKWQHTQYWVITWYAQWCGGSQDSSRASEMMNTHIILFYVRWSGDILQRIGNNEQYNNIIVCATIWRYSGFPLPPKQWAPQQFSYTCMFNDVEKFMVSPAPQKRWTT